MSGCERCLDKAWKYKYSEGWIIATCQMCGHEVQFEAHGKRQQRQRQQHLHRRKPDQQTNAYRTNPPGSKPPW